MSRLVVAAGLLLAALGACVVLLPFVSVWRLSGQLLDELPEIAAATTTDEHHRLGAFFDDDFVLATRVYDTSPIDAVTTALTDDGFEPVHADGRQWLAKPCCGDYDGIWVDVREEAPGSVSVVATVADADVQTSWPILVLFGGVVAAVGSTVAYVAGGRRQPTSPTPSVGALERT